LVLQRSSSLLDALRATGLDANPTGALPVALMSQRD
jgi:hypothetical protein